MNVERATSEDVFDFILILEIENFYLKKERDIYMIDLRNGI